MKYTLKLHKMKTEAASPVHYSLQTEQQNISLNEFIGQKIRLQFLNKIFCIACEREIKKSFSQGYCFPCSQNLPECDFCIVKPELCHYAKGTCRDPKWGETNCMIEHTIYLANSTDLKVGITRLHQQKTRWMDQGATQALPIFKTSNRLDSGKVEVTLKMFAADKTNWRKLLTSDGEKIDLISRRDDIYEKTKNLKLPAMRVDSEVFEFSYPIQSYPSKVASFDFEKLNHIESVLTGIKGQYLLFENGALNIRKHSGFLVELEV